MSSFDLYQTVTDRIVAMLETGVVPWRSPILGLGLKECHDLALHVPIRMAESISWHDALAAKAHLENGYFPPDRDWLRPTEGQTCCAVSIREADETNGPSPM
jgi:hypothetical protein